MLFCYRRRRLLEAITRVSSSVGRALPLQGRCRQFDSVLTHSPLNEATYPLFIKGRLDQVIKEVFVFIGVLF